MAVSYVHSYEAANREVTQLTDKEKRKIARQVFTMPVNNEPEIDEAAMWVCGGMVPLLFAAYGLACIINKVGSFPIGGRAYPYPNNIPFSGMDSAILGLFYLCIAFLLHFNFFWLLSKNEKWSDNYKYGKFASVLILIPSFAWVIWCLLRSID